MALSPEAYLKAVNALMHSFRRNNVPLVTAFGTIRIRWGNARMDSIPPELTEVCQRVERGEIPSFTVREVLQWASRDGDYAAARRLIARVLAKLSLTTRPNVVGASISSIVHFYPTDPAGCITCPPAERTTPPLPDARNVEPTPQPQPPCTIRAAFPMLSEDEIAGLHEGLAPHSPVASLTESDEADLAFDRIAVWMLHHPSTCFGTCLPGLWLIRDELLKDAGLPGRVVMVLSRLSITAWSDTLEFTPSVLLDMQGFREGNLQQFLAATAHVSAEACCRGTPPARCPVVDVFEQRRFPPKTSLLMSELHSLVDWASNEARAKTLADFIAACERADVPDDIALLSKSLGGMPLAELFPGIERTDSLEQLVNDLCGILDQRSRVIFLSRISLDNARTLEHLAGEMNITRERVRQLQVSAEAKINEALRSQRYATVAWRAHTLAGLLGVAVPRDSDYLDQAIRRATQGVADAARALVTEVLLWIAGPYFWDRSTGWLRFDEIPEQTIVNDCSDPRERVDIDRVRQVLSERGLVPPVHDAWVDQFGMVKQMQDTWLVWTGSALDKAVRLLGLWGEPATPETLVNAIAEGHDVKATRSRLCEDERVMRVDMTRFGLRSWGLEEYSGIADEIDQELERRGGAAEVEDLITTLVERFGLRESSIKAYLSVPMFVLEGTTVRRRMETDPFPAVGAVTETPGCYLLAPDIISWRIEVSVDTLRGSGRLMPAPIANWLGMTPGSQRVLAADGSKVRVTWPIASLTGPTLGSTRFLADRIAAQPGDQVLLFINRDEGTIDISRVDAAAVEASHGFERLALLTGIPNGDGERRRPRPTRIG